MMFKEICEFIADQADFIKGTTLQVGHRTQSAPDRCVLVSESAGGEANLTTWPDCRDMANFNIQVVSRAKTYFQARDDAWAVYEVLHGTAGWNLPNILGSGPNYLAMTISAMAIPQYIGQDENGRYEFSTNYIFRMEQGSCSEPVP